MTGFTFRLAAAASAFVLASGPVAGQQLYAAGLAGVVEHLRSGGVVHTLSTVSGDGDERCTASGAALAAEAERTLRQSGFAARPLHESDRQPVVLPFIRRVSVYVGSATCATFIDMQVTLRGELGLVVLAAEGGHLTNVESL